MFMSETILDTVYKSVLSISLFTKKKVVFSFKNIKILSDEVYFFKTLV